MPREIKENPENMENQPRPDHHLHPEHPMPDDERDSKYTCSCQDGKPCLCAMYRKHWWIKLAIALLIFLAGYGAAMMCRCMSHKHGGYPHHCAMSGKMGMARYTDGAGNVIIVNTDGHSADVIRHKMPKPMKAPVQQQMPIQQSIPAQNMQMQNLPMIPVDDEE